MSKRLNDSHNCLAKNTKKDIILESVGADKKKGVPDGGWEFWRIDDKEIKQNVDRFKLKLFIKLAYLQNQPISGWSYPEAEKLKYASKKVKAKIYAIRFIWEKVQQRPLGCFSGGKFFILLWAIEKGDKYLPRGYQDIVDNRFQMVEDRKIAVVEIKGISKQGTNCNKKEQ